MFSIAATWWAYQSLLVLYVFFNDCIITGVCVYYVKWCWYVEAVRAIIVYSDNPAELLRRKKVRREVLFKYADQEQIAVKPDDEKLTLIQRILHHLGSRPLPVGYNVVQTCLTLPWIGFIFFKLHHYMRVVQNVHASSIWCYRIVFGLVDVGNE